MRGAISPLPNTPSWYGAQLKNTGTTLPLSFRKHAVDSAVKWPSPICCCTLYRFYETRRKDHVPKITQTLNVLSLPQPKYKDKGLYI